MMTAQRGEFVQMFAEFVTKGVAPGGPLDQLRQILMQPASNEHFSVKISATEVSDRNHMLGNSLLQNPTEMMPCLDEALHSVQQRLSVDPRAPAGLAVKENVHAVRSRAPRSAARQCCRRALQSPSPARPLAASVAAAVVLACRLTAPPAAAVRDAAPVLGARPARVQPADRQQLAQL